VLPVSSLSPLDVLLPARGNAFVVCQDCRHWVEVKRGLVQTHHPGGDRCDGSAQVINFDLAWVEQQAAERRAAASAKLAELRAAARQDLRDQGSAHHPGKALREGRRAQARRIAAHGAQQHAEQQVRDTAATAIEAGWEGLARVPEAPSVVHIAARRAGRHRGAAAGYGQTELWLSPAEIGRANMAPRPERRALTSPSAA
jgi:hypothetical protein